MAQTSTLALVLLWFLGTSIAEEVFASDRWAEAERSIVRHPPAKFPSVPAKVRAFIRDRGCLVPQPDELYMSGAEPMNVISGEFAKPGQTDWAILCSRGGQSAILLFWGGDAPCKTTIAETPDRSFLQVVTVDRIGFSRVIAAFDPEKIRETYKRVGVAPPSVDHDAINDAFAEKASDRYYCSNGRWKELMGAD